MKEALKVLIVDDDEEDYEIISEYIQRIPGSKFITDWCPDYFEAVALMRGARYDGYLVDYRLGMHTGVDFLKEANLVNCEEPIILLTGKGDMKIDVKAMQLGAVDYLIKSELGIETLERSIRYALDRTNAMKALKANERKYRNIFEQSKDLIFIADENLNFIDVNDAAEKMLGYAKQELLQMNFIDLIQQSQHKNFIKQKLLSEKEILDQEVLLGMNDGQTKNSIITVVIEKNILQGQQTNYHGIIHDITNLKKIEKTTLQVEKLATVGRLIRTLAHEVRNPLNNITLSVDQLKSELENENAEIYIDIIQRNSKRINDLISELLNTSKSSAIELKKHSVQTVLDDVIDKSIDRLTLNHIKLRLDFPEEPIYILADKEKLVIALLNIVINAVEAMTEHEGALLISITKNHPHAVLSIADNGCGITEEHISRLFEPYFTQKRNGMGLGLASTLNVLQAHGASIDVLSKITIGTTFNITIPIIS